MKLLRRLLSSQPAAACLLLLFGAGLASAQVDQPLRSITYRLAMSRPASHLFEVTVEVALPNNAKAESLDFQMAKWAPGRYAVFDFAKNVQEVQAVGVICPPNADCDTPPLPITRVDD